MLAVVAAILFAIAVILHLVGGSGLFLSYATFIGLGLMSLAIHLVAPLSLGRWHR